MSDKKKNKKIGLVMPISAIDDLSEQHWIDVKKIIEDSCKSIEEYNISIDLVSNDESRDIIHGKIVFNLFDSDVVICDVSKKNPNVMFELGMRLAFDKPIVMVKDNVTDFSFDTSIIQHIIYPRTLRHSDIEIFKKKVRDKVICIFQAVDDGKYISYFKDSGLGTISVPDIQTKSVSLDEFVISELKKLSRTVTELNRHIFVDRKITGINRREYLELKNLSPHVSEVSESLLEDFLYPILDKHIAINGTDNISISELADVVFRKKTPIIVYFTKEQIEPFIESYLKVNDIDYLSY